MVIWKANGEGLFSIQATSGGGGVISCAIASGMVNWMCMGGGEVEVYPSYSEGKGKR